MSLVEDIDAALTAGGYSNIRYYRFDSSTVDQICVIPGGGTVDMVASSNGLGGSDIARPNVQIQVRDAVANRETAQDRALAIIALLHRSSSVANCLALIWNGRAPDFWTDDNDLNIFSIDFKVFRTPGTI